MLSFISSGETYVGSYALMMVRYTPSIRWMRNVIRHELLLTGDSWSFGRSSPQIAKLTLWILLIYLMEIFVSYPSSGRRVTLRAQISIPLCWSSETKRAVCHGGLSVAVAGTSIMVRIFLEARVRSFVFLFWFSLSFSFCFECEKRHGLLHEVSWST